jgi:DNA ligase-associated metallophosphoesterase
MTADAYDYRGLTLLPQRAVWQAETRTLWIADLHLGKAASFRAQGQPVPRGTTRGNLDRLGALVDAHGARRLVVLGDFFHARSGRTPGLLVRLREWRARRGLECFVVRGNHDAHAGDPPADCGFVSLDEPFARDGVEGWHHHSGRDDSPGDPLLLSGHIHPVARLAGPGRDRLRLPCFCLRGRLIVLPSFGEFTGGRPVDPCDWDGLVVTTGERLFPIKPPSARIK